MATFLLETSYFQERVKQEIARSKRSGVTFVVAVFTILSDYGEHPEVACVRALPRLLEQVRATDSVCRISDDSVAVLLVDADAAGSRTAASRLVTALRQHARRWDVRVVERREARELFADLGLSPDDCYTASAFARSPK